jgi:O-antigen/teichoic acid export membrane protein
MATWGVTLVVLVVAPNYLGPEDFGIFGFSASLIGFFMMLASLGTTPLLIKLIARDSSILGTYVRNAVVLKLLMVTVLSGVAVLIAWLLGNTGETLVVVAIGCVGMLFAVLNDVFVGAFAGLERMGRPAMWGVVQVYVGSIIAVAIMVAGGGIIPVSVVFAAAWIIPMVANGRAIQPFLGESRHLDVGVWKALVVGGVPLMILHGLLRAYGTIDIPILQTITNNTTVGWYALAYRLVTIPIFIGSIATRAFFPQFSAHGKPPTAEFSRLVNRAVRLTALVAVPAAAGIAVVASDVVDLIYGPKFAGAVPIMQVLATHIPSAAVGLILGSALVASDRQRGFVIVAAIAAVCAPFLYIVGINWGVREFDNGGIGAAWATVVIEYGVLTGSLLVRSKGVMDRPTALHCVRCVLAGLTMAAIVLAVDDVLLPARIVIGAIVYFGASLALRTLSTAHIRRATAMVSGTFSSRRRRGLPHAAEEPPMAATGGALSGPLEDQWEQLVDVGDPHELGQPSK